MTQTMQIFGSPTYKVSTAKCCRQHSFLVSSSFALRVVNPREQPKVLKKRHLNLFKAKTVETIYNKMKRTIPNLFVATFIKTRWVSQCCQIGDSCEFLWVYHGFAMDIWVSCVFGFHVTCV